MECALYMALRRQELLGDDDPGTDEYDADYGLLTGPPRKLVSRSHRGLPDGPRRDKEWAAAEAELAKITPEIEAAREREREKELERVIRPEGCCGATWAEGHCDNLATWKVATPSGMLKTCGLHLRAMCYLVGDGRLVVPVEVPRKKSFFGPVVQEE